MQEKSSFPITDLPNFKLKLLQWAQQFEVAICLDSHDSDSPHRRLDYLVAVDAIRSLHLKEVAKQFEALKQFQEEAQDKIFGYLSYDVKNQIENLYSANRDELNFPSMYFFEPRYVFEIKGGQCAVNRSTLEALHLLDLIEQQAIESDDCNQDLDWETHISKEEYLKSVKEIQQHIINGDVYELNFCRELSCYPKEFNALHVFNRINAKAKAPFSAFLQFGHRFVLSFSPERFIQHENGKLLSQPIKGTVGKGQNAAENQELKQVLLNDEKERAENVMIVDLVRNDFARSAIPGTVKVDELFGIYEFENIIQMISTVSATCRKDIHPLEALKNAFPMGSMTGAPKIRAMQLIEDFEVSKRGVYSGALGYIDTNGNYDFNVLIRTLLYDADKKYLSLHVGGAITYDSIPEKEWYESELKAKSILNFL